MKEALLMLRVNHIWLNNFIRILSTLRERLPLTMSGKILLFIDSVVMLILCSLIPCGTHGYTYRPAHSTPVTTRPPMAQRRWQLIVRKITHWTGLFTHLFAVIVSQHRVAGQDKPTFLPWLSARKIRRGRDHWMLQPFWSTWSSMVCPEIATTYWYLYL